MMCSSSKQELSSSWDWRLFGHNRHRPKRGGLLCPFPGELGPHLTQCRLRRGLHAYQVVSWCIQPFGHNRTTTTRHHNRFTALFQDHPGEPVPEENSWTLWCKGRPTEADTATIRLVSRYHSIRTNQFPPPPSPMMATTEMGRKLGDVYLWG